MTLLVCVDETSTTPRVLRHAVAFAKASGLGVHVIRVLDPRIDLVQGKNDSDQVIADVAAALKDEVSKQLEEAGGSGQVSIPVLEAKDSVAATIIRTAESTNAKAIAMGSHGAGLFRRTVLGSVAMGVVAGARVPALVVGPQAPEAPATDTDYTLLIADDGSQASRACIDALQPLLRNGRLRLVLMHLYEPRLGDEGEEQELRAALEGLETERDALPNPELATCLVGTLPDFERVDAAILRVAEELGVQAVAMATRGYSARQHILAGSVAVGVLKHAKTPVMLVRRP